MFSYVFADVHEVSTRCPGIPPATVRTCFPTSAHDCFNVFRKSKALADWKGLRPFGWSHTMHLVISGEGWVDSSCLGQKKKQTTDASTKTATWMIWQNFLSVPEHIRGGQKVWQMCDFPATPQGSSKSMSGSSPTNLITSCVIRIHFTQRLSTALFRLQCLAK